MLAEAAAVLYITLMLPEMVGLAVVVMVTVTIMHSQMAQQILEAAEEGEGNQLLSAHQAAAAL